MKRSKLCQIGLFVLLVLSLLGCGGAGGSGSGSFNLFITDDASAQYSGVWVKLFKAEMKGDGDKSVVLFESAEGVTVNLRQLNDGASKFLLLAPTSVPDGTYNKIQFEVSKTVDLVATGTGAASTAVFPEALNGTAGNSLLVANLSPNIVIPGTTKVVVDFDLKHWDVVNGVITPVLKHHDGSGLEDGSRHERFEYHGLMGNLSGTAPTQSFDLTLRTGGTVHVITDDSTDIVGEGDNAGLANGQRAEVYGIFDPTSGSVKANIIHFVGNHEGNEVAKATGKASNALPESGTFDLAPKYTKGFAPKGDTVAVVTNGETKFRGRRGLNLTQIEFFSAMATAGANASIDVKGTYDEGSNTINAREVHIEHEAEFEGALAAGRTSNPDSEAMTFDLAISHSSGMEGIGDSVKVQLMPDAEIKGPHGVVATKQQFFSLLAEKPRTLGVKGAYNPETQTLVASRIEYVVDTTVNFTAKGATSNPDNQLGTFDYLISQVQGIDLPHSSPIHLSVTANTEIKGPDGEAINMDQFFNLLIAGSRQLKIAGTATLPSGQIVIQKVEVLANETISSDARGTTSSPNAEGGAFALAMTEHHGFDPAEDSMLVVLAEGAILKGPQGISINRAQLFSYLTEHSRTVKVTGDYSDGVFTAKKVELIISQ